jgi:hypothetical protein
LQTRFQAGTRQHLARRLSIFERNHQLAISANSVSCPKQNSMTFIGVPCVSTEFAERSPKPTYLQVRLASDKPSLHRWCNLTTTSRPPTDCEHAPIKQFAILPTILLDPPILHQLAARIQQTYRENTWRPLMSHSTVSPGNWSIAD